MGLPFYQVSLGGLKDSSLLNGTAKYWKGSHPGILAKILAEKGPNCVVYLDELDKVSMEHAIDIYGYLTHAFDPVTNNRISDNFLGIELDFSGLTFVLSFNDPTVLSTPLLDRISTVYLKDFTRDEKVTIVQSYLLKEVLTSFRIPLSAVQWEPGVPEYIVDSLPGTEGVRSHKRLIHKIISTLLIDLLDSSSGCQQLADHSPGLRLAGTGNKGNKGKKDKSTHTGFKFRFNRRQIALPYLITRSDVH
jgi:ATP-dependent Lon protease